MTIKTLVWASDIYLIQTSSNGITTEVTKSFKGSIVVSEGARVQFKGNHFNVHLDSIVLDKLCRGSVHSFEDRGVTYKVCNTAMLKASGLGYIIKERATV